MNLDEVKKLYEKHNAEGFFSFQKLLIVKNWTLKTYQDWAKNNKIDARIIKIFLVDKILEWGAKDPKRTSFVKFYLESYNHEFFREEKIRDDNIIINMKYKPEEV